MVIPPFFHLFSFQLKVTVMHKKVSYQHEYSMIVACIPRLDICRNLHFQFKFRIEKRLHYVS